MQSRSFLEFYKDYPLFKHTSLGIGGSAKLFYEPSCLSDFALFLKEVSDEKIFLLGFGSNVLISDEGLDGLVICVKKLDAIEKIDEIKKRDQKIRVKAQAGLSCSKLVQFCLENSIGEAEFLSGIPGTVGGALAMNAGAFGSEIWNFVDFVETLNRNGEIRTRAQSDFEVGYRFVRMPKDEWFVSAQFSFIKRDKSEIKRIIREFHEKRVQSQPIGERTCGSVFCNPKGDSAGRLIDSLGLKGMAVGGVKISEKHANFMVNTGGGTYSDAIGLIDYVKGKVKDKFSIDLQLEVVVLD